MSLYNPPPASGGSPALPLGSVQFNSAGSFGGDSTFTIDPVTKIVSANKIASNLINSQFPNLINPLDAQLYVPRSTMATVGPSGTVSIVSGGSGYTAGDVITYSGSGNGDAQFTVAVVSGGSVTALALQPVNRGTGYAVSNPTGQATTGGTGSGLTLKCISYIVDLYTVPANTRAYIPQFLLYGSTGAFSQSLFVKTTEAIPQYRLINSLVAESPNAINNIASIPFVYEPGEKVSMLIQGTFGQSFLPTIWANIYTFSNASNLKTYRFYGIASGNNTIYTYSGASVLKGIAITSTNPGLRLPIITPRMVNYENATVSGITSYDAIGGTVNSDTVVSTTNLVANSLTSWNMTLMLPGDSIVVNVPSSMPNSWIWFTAEEI